MEKFLPNSSESGLPNRCVALATSSESSLLRWFFMFAFKAVHVHSTLLPLLSAASCPYRAQNSSQFPASLKAMTTVCTKILDQLGSSKTLSTCKESFKRLLSHSPLTPDLFPLGIDILSMLRVDFRPVL